MPAKSIPVAAETAFPEVMSVRHAAAYLGVSIDTLYKYLATRQVPGFRLGNRWRFKKTLLDEWITGLSLPPQTQSAPPRARKRQRA